MIQPKGKRIHGKFWFDHELKQDGTPKKSARARRRKFKIMT